MAKEDDAQMDCPIDAHAYRKCEGDKNVRRLVDPRHPPRLSTPVSPLSVTSTDRHQTRGVLSFASNQLLPVNSSIRILDRRSLPSVIRPTLEGASVHFVQRYRSPSLVRFIPRLHIYSLLITASANSAVLALPPRSPVIAYGDMLANNPPGHTEEERSHGNSPCPP